MFSFSIHSWMISDLKLSGNELLVYGIIYHFSSIPKNYFTASLSTISETLNISLNTVQRTLKKLVETNLIIKEDVIVNNTKYCRYCANLNMLNTEEEDDSQEGYSQNGYGGIAKMANKKYNNTNNIDNKQSNKQITTRGLFSNDKNKEKKSVNFERMVKMISGYCICNHFSEGVKKHLIDYLQFRFKRGLEPVQWERILAPINKRTEEDVISHIDNALAGGYMVLVPSWEINKYNKPIDNIVRDYDEDVDHTRSEEGF